VSNLLRTLLFKSLTLWQRFSKCTCCVQVSWSISR